MSAKGSKVAVQIRPHRVPFIDGRVRRSGEVVELPVDEAEALIAAADAEKPDEPLDEAKVAEDAHERALAEVEERSHERDRAMARRAYEAEQRMEQQAEQEAGRIAHAQSTHLKPGERRHVTYDDVLRDEDNSEAVLTFRGDDPAAGRRQPDRGRLAGPHRLRAPAAHGSCRPARCRRSVRATPDHVSHETPL